jgi:hypothetical protein
MNVILRTIFFVVEHIVSSDVVVSSQLPNGRPTRNRIWLEGTPWVSR